jgi:hypothetical protein
MPIKVYRAKSLNHMPIATPLYVLSSLRLKHHTSKKYSCAHKTPVLA